jgi:hypothetical protein
VPVAWSYDAAHGVLCVRLHGEVTDDDLLDYARHVTTDPGLPAKHHELIDLRDVRAPSASTATLRRVAQLFEDAEREPAGVRIGFVATSDAAYGLARMYQALRDRSPAQMRVFRDMAEARSWLGLPPE